MGRPARDLPSPLWLVRNHPRLFGSISLSVAAFVVLTLASPHTRMSTRLLLAWDAGVLVYVVLAFTAMSHFDLALVRRQAAIQDEGGMAILVLTVASAVASLGAIAAELGSVTRNESRAPYLGLAAVTILLSWTFIQVIFAFHYAYEYYGDGVPGGGLQFPADDCPDYWDFVYFSFVIGMTFQVSDVQVTSKTLRRMVVAHGGVAFLFNVAILALMVNLAAGLFDGR